MTGKQAVYTLLVGQKAKALETNGLTDGWTNGRTHIPSRNWRFAKKTLPR